MAACAHTRSVGDRHRGRDYRAVRREGVAVRAVVIMQGLSFASGCASLLRYLQRARDPLDLICEDAGYYPNQVMSIGRWLFEHCSGQECRA